MYTWRLHIEGQVQGVGFRPFVYQLARQYHLNGWVNNTLDGVHIEINASESDALQFYAKLIEQAPILSKITAHSIKQSATQSFVDFQIIHSQSEGEAKLLLTPDFAICEECRLELFTAKNRRQNYPFITCTNCGPRYSIIQSLPYDRPVTTMDVFPMCPVCQAEYDNPLDRRYYSQTNSCPSCGIELILFDAKAKEISRRTDEILDHCVRFWRKGKIIAVKGIGGYLLTCDAENEAVIREMRIRKHRPSKPFALMYPNLETLAKDAILRKKEKEALQSPAAPIVLLSRKKQLRNNPITKAITPGLRQIGVMLPYAPLYECLLKKFGRSIVATSANISNSPIVFEDAAALKELSSIADFILSNNRKIVVPQDDSVFKFTPFKQQKIILRRSRGLAPTYINAALDWPPTTILATGAMLKSAFALLHQDNAYISQYLGDLEHFDAQENYRHTVRHFLDMLKTKPELILVDKHPNYASTQYGEELAREHDISFLKIQHHIAHFGAVLGENNLIHAREAVLGVVWDGTGLGDDGQIWGGEFFLYQNYRFERRAHFEYFDFILGDKMPREPRISALSACWGLEEARGKLKEKFTQKEWQIYGKMLQKGSALKTSSLGRIFDAVASLLDLSDKQSFEGEAAMRLEALAEQYFQENDLAFSSSYFEKSASCERIPTPTLMKGILADLNDGKSKAFIAAKFHFSLANLIGVIAQNLKTRKLAFSGGVFQNSVLVDLILYHFNDAFNLYFHRELSPNDEGICFGQLICHSISQIQL